MSELSIVNHRLFNSSVETALRVAHLLNAIAPYSADLERLISYDYLLVHSGDVDNGPSSLHPAVPFRGSEWLIKRERIQGGLQLLTSRELAEHVFKDGISYSASELTNPFLKLLKTDYSQRIASRSEWVSSRFSQFTDKKLSDFMTEHAGRWGAEFDRLSIMRELEL